ncbi:MAG TPA: Gfo/Idh/MocA family oxidoreductase [Gemmatimonadota bacterium]|nr:Gfo/Idh/MocA family oxidoreductase [Gemmatimonadota bacterium]
MRILQIGVGIRGGHWATIVRDYPDAVCVGYVDPDAGAIEKVRALGGENVSFFGDLDEALAATSADAALIASPSSLHAEHAMRALGAGLAVMVEKPFALTVEQASRVLERAETSGKPVMVADNYRYWPAERTVRKLVQDGLVGRLDSATLIDRRHMPSHTEGPWLASIEYPQLQEVAIHHFDSLRSFFGLKPTSIAARAWNSPWSDYRHGANTEALIDFEGVRVQYLGTMTSHRFSFSLWIEGESGVIWTNRKYVFSRPAGSRFFRPVRAVKVPSGDEARYPRGGTTSLLDSLRDAVREGKAPETEGRDSIWNVAMVEAAKRSDREGRTVRIEEVYAGPPMAR